jgi:hypothetical protein
MAPQNIAKPKRHKKRKSRTEGMLFFDFLQVMMLIYQVSSDSESERESVPQPISGPTKESENTSKKSKSKSSLPDPVSYPFASINTIF